jgi:hypothetical protein
MDLMKRINHPDEPWFHVFVGSAEDLSNAVRAVERTRKTAARVVRGKIAVTETAFFSECAAALQFPLYFGENWDAFRDCMLDLAWLEAPGCALIIADALHLLEKAKPEAFSHFVRIVTEAAGYWNEQAKPKPFHVVLHAMPADKAATISRYGSAGMATTGR